MIDKDKKRKDIIKHSFQFLRTHYLHELTSRTLAKKMHCSTQVIYYVFDNFNEVIDLTIQEVIKYTDMTLKSYQEYENPILNFSMAYIDFAHYNYYYFQLLFVDNIKNDDIAKYREHQLDTAASNLNFDFAQFTKDSSQSMTDSLETGLIFLYGLAFLVHGNSLPYEEERLIKYIQEGFSLWTSKFDQSVYALEKFGSTRRISH